MFVSLNNNTTDVTSVAETSNPSKAPELIPVINGVRATTNFRYNLYGTPVLLPKRYFLYFMFLARLTRFDGRLPPLDSLYIGRCYVEENGVYNNHQASVLVSMFHLTFLHDDFDHNNGSKLTEHYKILYKILLRKHCCQLYL
jgi:hypothetical protein